MRWFGLHLPLLLTLRLVASCASPDPATEVLVVVSSDLMVAAELSELRVDVYPRVGPTTIEARLISQPLVLATARVRATARAEPKFTVPLSFSLTPSDGAKDFRVVVTGRGPGPTGAIIDKVEQQAIGAFLRGQKLWIPIYLQRNCLLNFCRAEGAPLGDQTCINGECEMVSADPLGPAGPGDLGPLDGALPPPRSTPEASTRDAETDADAGDGARDAQPDADASSDASDADARMDAPDADAGPESEPVPCGTWVATNKDMPVPPNAISYGIEYNDMGTFDQYVCRLPLVGGSYVNGKGVFGFSCYAFDFDNQTPLFSDAFEVLVDSGCAVMSPVATADPKRYLQTGTDRMGNKTYSCASVETSMGVMPAQPVSNPLGRYDPVGNRCVFEWYSTFKASSGTNFSMLTIK